MLLSVSEVTTVVHVGSLWWHIWLLGVVRATVAVNKKFTFRIRTTIVVRTENLRSVLRNFSVL